MIVITGTTLGWISTAFLRMNGIEGRHQVSPICAQISFSLLISLDHCVLVTPVQINTFLFEFGCDCNVKCDLLKLISRSREMYTGQRFYKLISEVNVVYRS